MSTPAKRVRRAWTVVGVIVVVLFLWLVVHKSMNGHAQSQPKMVAGVAVVSVEDAATNAWGGCPTSVGVYGQVTFALRRKPSGGYHRDGKTAFAKIITHVVFEHGGADVRLEKKGETYEKYEYDVFTITPSSSSDSRFLPWG